MGELVLDDVTVAYGDVHGVDGVDLRVRDGEFLSLVGPSGCGKTTLLRTIAGLESPTAGEVVIGGTRATALPARKRDVSLVFQDDALFPHMTVRENVSFDLRMQGYDGIDERVDEVAALLEIGDLLDRTIDELSGGQRRRVALGRAIATEPTAFLLDEPLAGLDASLRQQTRTEIVRLQERLDVTTVHVTHDQAEALTMGDRVAVMKAGQIEQVGTPEAVYRSPTSLFVARFVGDPTMNFLRGRHADGAVTVEREGDARSPTLPFLAGDGWSAPEDLVLGVRPEDVTLDGSEGAGDAIHLTATVERDEFHGADRYLHLDAPGLPDLVARAAGTTDVERGRPVEVALPAERIHWFDAATGRRIPRPDAPAADREGAAAGDAR